MIAFYRRHRVETALVLALMRSAAFGEEAGREEPSRKGVEEIVVTAQRREQSLQEVPISMTAFGEAAIEEREINSVADIQHATPGFVYAKVGSNAQATIRGVGSDIFSVGGEPGVALYLDDIYLGRSFLPQAALVQIERIEVLRGPQGTLYGRNTSGGALKFVSKRPVYDLEATAGVQAGSFDQWLGEASVSGPVVEDVLAARLSLFAENRDGWLENLTTGENLEDHEVFSGRFAVDSSPLDWLTIGVTADFTHQDDGGPVFQPLTPVVGTLPSGSAALPIFRPYDAIIRDLERNLGVVLDPLRERLLANLVGGRDSDDPREVYLDGPSESEIESLGVASNLAADLGFGEAVAILGYRDSSFFQRFDGDGSEVPIATFDPRTEDGEQVSVELHLKSAGELPLSLGSFNALGGFFHYREDASERYFAHLFALSAEDVRVLEETLPPDLVAALATGDLQSLRVDSEQQTRSLAGFGQFDWDPFERVTLHLGARYTIDDKDFLQTVVGPNEQDNCRGLELSESFSAFTGKAGIDVRLADAHMLYGSFSQGFKAGGFNNANCDDPFEPEFVDAFEVGVKTEWLDGLFRVNAAAFHYTFDDIQVQRIEGAKSFILNAAAAKIDGVELETRWVPWGDLSLDGSVSWLDARYEEFVDDDPTTLFEGPVDLSGNRLPRSPEWSANVGAEAPFPIGSLGELRPRVEWSYRDDLFFDHFNGRDNRQGAYHIWNAFLGFELENGHGGFRGFVKNFTDETYLVGGLIASTLIGGPLGHYAPPRTWGIEAIVRF